MDLNGSVRPTSHTDNGTRADPSTNGAASPLRPFVPDPRAVVGWLKQWFLNRTDLLAHLADWKSPCPIEAGDKLEPLLLAHVLGDAAPPVNTRWVTKDGKSGPVHGRPRLGSYSPAADGRTRFGCIDCDGGGRHGSPLADPLGAALVILKRLERLGILAYLERSGSGTGWHVWVFFAVPVPASKVRKLLFAVIPPDVRLADGGPADARKNRGLEVFPKQDAIEEWGLGNMVWLPFWSGAAADGNLFYEVNGDGEIAPCVPEGFETNAEADIDLPLSRVAQEAKESARPPRQTHASARREDDGRVPTGLLLERALARATPGQSNGRNDTGLWLACQLRDNRYTQAEAEAALSSYAQSVPEGNDPYTVREAMASVAQAYRRPPREPWGRARHCDPDGKADSSAAGSGDKKKGDGQQGGRQNTAPEPPPWDDPIPINEVPNVDPFPLEVFPDPVALFVRAVSMALPCPPDYVALPAVVLAGGAIGASEALEIKAGWVERAALYGAVIAVPSSAKSPALKLAASPVYAEQARLHEIYLREKKAKEDGALEQKPKERTIYVADITTEKLAHVLQDTPRGVVMIRDELTAWVSSMNQYKAKGVGADRQFYLSAWASEPVSVHRQNQQAGPVFVAHPFLGIVGGLPPDLLSRLRGDRAVADGFFDRILFAYPTPHRAVGEDWRCVDTSTAGGWAKVMAKLWELQPQKTAEGKEHPKFVHLTDCGKRAWEAFTRGLADEMNKDEFPDHLRGPWGKFRGHCARLALILHRLRWAAGEAVGEDVGGESVRRAAKLVAYFQSHAHKVYCHLDADPRAEGAARAVNWLRRMRDSLKSQNCLKGVGKGTVTKSALHAGVWGGSRTVEDVERVIDLLVAHGYLRPHGETYRQGPGRKPSPTYEVHPSLWSSHTRTR